MAQYEKLSPLSSERSSGGDAKASMSAPSEHEVQEAGEVRSCVFGADQRRRATSP